MKYTQVPSILTLPLTAAICLAVGPACGQDGERRTNRLGKETSPYLLQHAGNPVDWYPWGEEAFAKAKRENKPVFLSIGYSSCHWCHVMERESFTDKEIADFLNSNFVCIKVDREERPDVDTIYMTAVHVYNQLTKSGRGGGWPLSAFLTPESEPFFAATYFPARDGDRGAGTGFLTIIKRVQEVWNKDSARIREDGKMLTRYVKLEMERRQSDLAPPLDSKVLAEAATTMAERFDVKHGGFSYDASNPNRPKFPEPSNLFFLLERAKRGDLQSQQMLETTLEKMALGGIRDHLAGGFHRYSVDRYWRIPHFEKMLYDNGQLASVYSEAFALTKREDFRRVVTELLTFVEREMTSPAGGFYSAIDADSEHEEGKFYRWELAEVRRLVAPAKATRFYEAYGLNSPPNFEKDFHVLQFSEPLAETAKRVGITESELDESFRSFRQALLDARAKRIRPITDDKILTSWNGLMIRGLADAGRILNNEHYIATAIKGAEFILKHSRDPDGKLKRTHSRGQSKLNAYLDDYAFFIDGLLAIHRATNDAKWLTTAEELQRKQNELFLDKTHGGYFFTSDDHEALLARAKDPVDGAEPSGNSVSAENLWYLAQQTNNTTYQELLEKTIRGAAGVVQQSPLAAPRMLAVYMRTVSDK